MIRSAKGIIVFKDSYLLQLRDKKKDIYYPNFWGLFGGQIKKTETSKRALKREIEEETNLIVKVTNMILSVNCKMIGFKNKTSLIYYECKIVGKRKIILTEGQKYKFFSFKQMKKLNIIPMDFSAINNHYHAIISRKKIFPKKMRSTRVS